MATTTATTRRLAAILAADVAGYSRLMGADEEGTHERLKAHFRLLFEPKIGEHSGRIVKNTGDGLLAEFPSVVDVVRCAAEVQRGMIDREPMVSDEQRIRFRIGVNLGDVIAAEDGDIFGDGVNVAARLEALAEPGGICVSGTVRDQIRDRLPYALDDGGEQSVKNIARPVRVYALRPEAVADLPARSVRFEVPRRRVPVFVAIAATAVALLFIAVGAWWLWPAPRSSPTPPAAVAVTATSIPQPLAAPRLSIVVLPFANLSNDPDQQYFADGMTEDLTTDLSRISDMFVIARNTALTYRDKPVNAKQIGRELGVRYVLEGSVQRSGKQVRITAQLIDADTGGHLWAERFDRDTGDLLALQSEITGRIAAALSLELVSAEAIRPTDHPEVLDYVFRARAAYNKGPGSDTYAEAVSLYEHALALDPRSVEALNGLGGTLAGRVMLGFADSPAVDLERAERLITQALAISPRNPAAHFAKAIWLKAQGRCEEAIPEFEMLIALNRNSVSVLANLGQRKIATGSMDQGIALQEQVIRLSPRDPFNGNRYDSIGFAYLLQSRTDEAIVWLEKGCNLSPRLSLPHAHLASAYALKGDLDRASAELAEARRLRRDGRFSSIARLKAAGWEPKVRALAEATYFVGLRKAGMPEE
jgi:TolB-like protein/class 3 adenylate cyclase